MIELIQKRLDSYKATGRVRFFIAVWPVQRAFPAAASMRERRSSGA